jgi:hypothetical protein
VRRLAQDDGFVGGLEIQLVGYAENTKRIEKVTGDRDDKGGRGVSIRIGCWDPRSQKRDLGHPSIVTDAVAF